MALEASLENFCWPKRCVPASERVQFTASLPLEIENVEDDLQREAAFYSQALENVRTAFSFLDSHKIPRRRPDDYFAEMIKTDDHMMKVKGVVEKTQADKADVERRKREREMKKFGKKVQQEKVRERKKEEKKNLDEIRKWRRERKRGGSGGTDKDLDAILKPSNRSSSTQRGKGKKRRRN